MTARQCAMLDIMQELKSNHKSFIPFRKELNKTINKMVNIQLKLQTSL